MGEQIYFDAIEVGDSLPVLKKRPTPRQLVMWAGAAGEFSEMHYDINFARERGFPGVIVHGMLLAAFIAQVLTDWVGEWGEIKKLKIKNERFLLVNEEVICTGTVIKKWSDGPERFVECELLAKKSDGEVCVSAKAIVCFPQKKGVGQVSRS